MKKGKKTTQLGYFFPIADDLQEHALVTGLNLSKQTECSARYNIITILYLRVLRTRVLNC